MTAPKAPWDAPEAAGYEKLDPSPTGTIENLDLFVSEEERAWIQLHSEALRLQNQQFERDITNRENFAKDAFGMTVFWVQFLIAAVVAQFVFGRATKFGLSDRAFIVLITTTTGSILGFWLLVGRYLFHRPNGEAKNGKRKIPKLPSVKTAKKRRKKKTS